MARGSPSNQNNTSFNVQGLKMLKINYSIHGRVSEIQNEHGLHRQDYVAYRQYCTNRIKRVRKKLKMNHVNGSKRNRTRFSYNDITPADVTNLIKKPIEGKKEEDLSHLPVEIVILECERAWAYGNQLKQEYHDIKDENSRVRNRFINRFRKASRRAEQLEKLMEEVGDEISHVEACAYKFFHAGSFYVEKEEWEKARESFQLAQNIYHKFSTEGSLSMKETFVKRVGMVADYIKICDYWIKDEGGEVGKPLEVNTSGVEMKLLKLFSGKKVSATESLSVVFLGEKIEVEGEKVKDILMRIRGLKTQLAKIVSAKSEEALPLGLFDDVLIGYRDVLVEIREDIRKNEKLQNVQSQVLLKKLHAHFELESIFTTVERNEHLIEVYSGYSDKKKTKPTDIIRLHEVALVHLENAKNVPFVSEHTETLDTIAARQRKFRIFKCFYLAHLYCTKMRFPEAYALLLRVQQLAAKREKYTFSSGDSAALDSLVEAVEQEKLIVKANNFLKDQPKRGIRLKKASIVDDLNLYKESRKINPFLIHFPPSFQAIPCKPLFFNVAGTKLEGPESVDLDKKVKKKWFGIF